MPPRDKVETDVEHIRDWMTIPFIAHMYRVPGYILFEAVKIAPEGNEKKSLLDLNKEYYPNESGRVLQTIKQAVKETQPPLPPASPTPPPP